MSSILYQHAVLYGNSYKVSCHIWGRHHLTRGLKSRHNVDIQPAKNAKAVFQIVSAYLEYYQYNLFRYLIRNLSSKTVNPM